MGFRAFYTWAKLASQSHFKGVLRHYFAQGIPPPLHQVFDFQILTAIYIFENKLYLAVLFNLDYYVIKYENYGFAYIFN